MLQSRAWLMTDAVYFSLCVMVGVQVGLCVNMKNVPWFESADPNLFFPRCYRLSNDEDKQAFIGQCRYCHRCRVYGKILVTQMLTDSMI